MKEQSKLAVIYARYSSDKQNEQSIEGQISVIESFAKKENFRIVDTYIDRALSGRSDDRPSFQKMIEDSKKGLFQYVIVYKLDRFSRDRYDSAIYKRKLKDNGVKVISATENIGDNPESIILESMLEGYSEYYSKELAQKVRRGNEESRKKGLFTGGVVPYGYRVKDKRYYIEDNEAKVVKDIYKKTISGMMLKDIAQELNDKSIPYKNGDKWDINRISRIIRSEKYIGIVRVNDEVYDNICPPIISKEVYGKVRVLCDRRMHENHTKREDCKYILSGKTFCTKCGSSITGKSAQNNKYHYYACSGRSTHTCLLPIFKKQELEDIVSNAVFDYLLGKDLEKFAKTMCDYYNDASNNDNELSILESRVKELDEMISNSIVAIQRGNTSLALQKAMEELEEEKRSIENKITSLKTRTYETIDYEEVVSYLKKISNNDKTDPKVKELVIKMLVKSVYIDEENIRIVFYPGDDVEIIARKDTVESLKEIDGKNNAKQSRLTLKTQAVVSRPPNMNRTLYLLMLF